MLNVSLIILWIRHLQLQAIVDSHCHQSSEFPTLEQSQIGADQILVLSPSLSITSWSNLNKVYQANSTATLEVINNALNSPHNTWNYPSPGSPCLQYPSLTQSPTVPWLPTVAASPEFIVPGFPFLAPTASPVYATSSADPDIPLIDPNTLEPCPIDPNPYII